MRVVVTGSHGLVGSALVAHLRERGDHVVPLVRGVAGPGEASWDPAAGHIDPEDLQGVGAVVHLAGAGVGDHRWSARYKGVILSSRLQGTATMAHALAAAPEPPAVLLSGSAVGYYGVRSDDELTEESGVGSGFLADLCARWEAATQPAAAAGVRVVHLRTGVVMSAVGGALKKQLPVFKLGLGARLGSGHQQVSWITRRDAVAALAFLLDHASLSGPVNVTAPAPVSNLEFTRALARALRRPAFLAAPGAVLRAAAGAEMTTEFLLASQRAFPLRLTAAGFGFADRTIEAGLATALGDRKPVPR